MSSLNTLTGVDGEHVVETTRIARTTKWSVNARLASSAEWGDSDSAGYTNRAAGRRDATFTSEGKFSTSAEQYDVFQEGDILISVLWMNGSLYWDFPRSLCTDFQLAVDIDTQDIIGWSSSWGADGLFYRPGESGATVRTLPP